MKRTRLSKLVVIAMLATLWSSSLPSVGWSRSARPILSSVIPRDVTGIHPNQVDFDTFAWQLFVALNWPTRDGKVDRTKIIGESPNAPRVWELYADPVNIFKDNDVDPGVLRLSVPKDSKLLYMVRKRVERISGSQDEQAASAWPLIDQNKNFALYEVRLNDIETSYIVSQGLTTPAGIQNYKKPILFPTGSIEVKASWRFFPENTPREVMARYHTRKALIAISKDQSSTGSAFQLEGTVGLAGFHIVCKTPSQRKWVWATFEQVDNYEIYYKPLPGLKPAFSSGTSTDPNRQPTPKPSNGTYLWSPKPPTAGGYAPSEVARCTNETSLPAALNTRWQTALADVPGVANSVWQYYRLNAIQWFDAKDKLWPMNEFGVAISRNSVLETYLLGDQTIASQVPAIGPTNSDPDITHPNTTLADTINATIVAAKTPDKTGSYTWSSCLICHELALYQFGPDAKTDNKMTDYSFVFKSYLPAGGSSASTK